MNWLVFGLIMLGLAVVQTSGVPPLPVVGVRPDLVLIFVLGWAMLRGVRSGLLWAFVGGLFLDLMASTPLGINALALAPVAILALASRIRLIEDDLFLSLPLALAGTLMYYTAFLLLRWSFGVDVHLWDSYEHVVLPAALVNTLSMPLVYWLLQWMQERIRWPVAREGA